MRNFMMFILIAILITTSFQSCVRFNYFNQEIANLSEECERKYLNTKTNEKMCNPIGYEEQPESNFSLLLKIFI